MLGQNIIFIAKEVGIKLVDDILTKVKVSSLLPKPVDDKKWGAFMGEFKTNFILPNYIGLGNGVTRGFGTLNGSLNSKIASSDETEMKDFYESESVDSISASDVPTPKRKRHAGQKKKKFNVKKKYKNPRNKKKKTFSNQSQNKQKRHRNSSNFKSQRFKHVISEGYHIEDTNGNSKKNDDINQNDDERFNTEKHHKQQHKF